MRVVVSLTTLPSRLEKETIIPTLKTAHKQTRKPDAVYLGLPKISKRLGTSYPEPSDKIKELCTIVRLEKDFGPVCKILGGLYAESDPSTIIITFDDDNLYPENFIEEMLKKHLERPKAAIGSSGAFIGNFPGYFAYIRNAPKKRYEAWWGAPVPEKGIKTDILCGYSGVLYLRGMFPVGKIGPVLGSSSKNNSKKSNYGTYFNREPVEINTMSKFLQIPQENGDLFLHDDIYLSSYLNSQGIERYLYIMPEVVQTGHHSNGLSDDSRKFIKTFLKAVRASHKYGLIKEKVPVGTTQTIVGRVLFIILLIVILIWFFFFFARRLARK